jgi:putative glutamine amidotransferase
MTTAPGASIDEYHVNDDRPRILVTLGRDLPHRTDQLRLPVSYVDAILAEHAIPVLMPPRLDRRAIEAFVRSVDGLLLPGGVDPHPRHFDEEVHPMTVVDEPLDTLEFATIDCARRAHMPILGICRGSQVLNVALGGSLIQHLETAPIDHKPNGPLSQHIHHIELTAGTRLHATCAVDQLKVNSWHHQAIGRLGRGLRVAARAEDGVIEAIESANPEEWVIGVQYHPEELTAIAAHRALLAEFVAAARARRAPSDHRSTRADSAR